MRSWRILPAAVLSLFVNIPWVAAKCADELAYGTKYVRLHSCYAAWVMELIYSLATAGLCWLPYVFGASMYPPAVMVSLTLVLPNVCIVSSMGLFMGLTGWIVRQRMMQEAGEKLNPALNMVTRLPAMLQYKWSRQTMSLELVADGECALPVSG